MHRYLLVLEEDLLTVDEELGLEPISYLVGCGSSGVMQCGAF